VTRALVLDVDGTIVSDESPDLSDDLKRSLDAACHAGWNIIFATSRTPRTMLGLGCSREWNAYGIICNGAAELDLEERKISRVRSMDCASVGELLARVREEEGDVCELEIALMSSPAPSNACDVTKVKHFRRGEWWSLKLTFRACRRSPGELIEMILAGLEHPPAITFREPDKLEVTAPGTGKLKSLQSVVGRLGLTSGDCIAFGDSSNDADVLAWCGKAFGVEPFPDYLLPLVDGVVAPPERGGVAGKIRSLLKDYALYIDDGLRRGAYWHRGRGLVFRTICPVGPGGRSGE
jgi:hydroxymethylpyrimidine pyrophosphatase-like HAD family hydrolase